MTNAWSKSPKSMSDNAKRSFLNELVQKAKCIGLKNTIDHLLPCILACFNSDSIIHPDTYEPHVKLMFENLSGVISFLDKGGNNSASDTDGEEGSDTDPKDGYYAIKNVLLEKIYLRFFSAERYEDTLLNDLREKVISQFVQITRILNEVDIKKKILPVVVESI
jgi:hypothetical protein